MKKGVILALLILALLAVDVNAGIICNDSDGGKNYSIRGQVCINGTGCILDDCMPDGLNERYCEGNESYTEKYTCPVACENGKCINGSSEKTMVECNDSDGRGNYAAKGNVTVKYSDNTSEKINDICGIDITGKRGARDYYCEASNYSFDFEVCNCEGGICSGYNATEVNNSAESNISLNESAEQAKQLKDEKKFGDECEKDYECESNLCNDNKCDKLTFFKKFIAWLDRLFGVERNY